MEGAMEFYHHKFIISGKEREGLRDSAKDIVLIPYSDKDIPDIEIGDIFTQEVGDKKIDFKVIDMNTKPSLKVGTKHSTLLKLPCNNRAADLHKPIALSSVTNIGPVTGGQVQVGNQNTQTIKINIQDLVEKVAASNDQKAKSLFRKLLENGTVEGIIGGGISGLLKLLP